MQKTKSLSVVYIRGLKHYLEKVFDKLLLTSKEVAILDTTSLSSAEISFFIQTLPLLILGMVQAE
jgi:hypothetical protein